MDKKWDRLEGVIGLSINIRRILWIKNGID